MTLAALSALFVTMVAVSAVPGPSDVAVVARALRFGLTGALLVIAGIVAADFVLIAIAVLSLTVLATELAGVYLVLNYACALFLLWLGVALWRARPAALDTDANAAPRGSRLTGFATGFLITLGDPKALAFYFGVFPAYADADRLGLRDALLLMLLATAAIALVKVAYALLADRARRLFASAQAQLFLARFAGTLLIGTAVLLVVRAGA